MLITVIIAFFLSAIVHSAVSGAGLLDLIWMGEDSGPIFLLVLFIVLKQSSFVSGG